MITDLQVGGAEIMLVRLLEKLGDRADDHSVVALSRPEPLAARLREMGVTVFSLGMTSKNAPRSIVALHRIIRNLDPDVLQGWMLHANVAGSLAAVGTHVPVVWGVHMSTISEKDHGRSAMALRRLEASLSHRFPAKIISCSRSGSTELHSLGYAESNIVTIPNGFDTDWFRPRPAAGLALREQLGISSGDTVVGHVSRFHPQKDQLTLLKAMEAVLQQDRQRHLILVGEGLDPRNPIIGEFAERFPSQTHALGRRNDTQLIFPALDLLVSSSSSGEAFPLVIGEAMAAGVPVVTTDIGDSADLVGDPRCVCPPRDHRRLTSAISEILGLPEAEREALGAAARERIVTSFQLGSILSRYEQIWKQCADGYGSGRLSRTS